MKFELEWFVKEFGVGIEGIVKGNLSHEVSSYLHYKVLYSYPFLGIISILQCYKIDIKELSSRENLLEM